MATYIILLGFTQKGIETIKEGPARLDRAKQAFKAAGAELKAFYLVTGRYDAVALVEAPSDDVVARVVLTAGSMGTIRSETLRAFTEDEFRKIVASLP
ncbi:MAG TPA: GYD domain-containing protein [Candidatus Methylomirabilis sp.]|nr:GYD domain-containing protein [Candidatus Methylomirabilis sp.]